MNLKAPRVLEVLVWQCHAKQAISSRSSSLSGDTSASSLDMQITPALSDFPNESQFYANLLLLRVIPENPPPPLPSKCSAGRAKRMRQAGDESDRNVKTSALRREA